jgi:hypothetical protein
VGWACVFGNDLSVKVRGNNFVEQTTRRGLLLRLLHSHYQLPNMRASVVVLSLALFSLGNASILEPQAAGAGAAVAVPSFTKNECDIIAPNAICLFDGQKVLLPDSVPDGLVGHWTFDEVKPIDSSGRGNHGEHSIAAGPGVMGQGASAMFNGFDFVSIPHSKDFTGGDFSVTFWMYLYKDPKALNTHGEAVCPILRKGSAGKAAPGILLNTHTGKLTVRLTTTSEAAAVESVVSDATVRKKAWVHIGLVRKGSKTQLFVNGVLDKEKTTMGASVANEGKLYVGGTPDRIDKCHLAMYVDGLRFYNNALTIDHVQAEAGPALSGIEPAMVRLGCAGCSLDLAGKSCPANYHLCTAMELHTGGYQVGRINGYANHESRIWTHAEYKTRAGGNAVDMDKVFDSAGTLADQGKKGVGICCIDFR